MPRRPDRPSDGWYSAVSRSSVGSRVVNSRKGRDTPVGKGCGQKSNCKKRSERRSSNFHFQHRNTGSNAKRPSTNPWIRIRNFQRSFTIAHQNDRRPPPRNRLNFHLPLDHLRPVSNPIKPMPMVDGNWFRRETTAIVAHFQLKTAFHRLAFFPMTKIAHIATRHRDLRRVGVSNGIANQFRHRAVNQNRDRLGTLARHHRRSFRVIGAGRFLGTFARTPPLDSDRPGIDQDELVDPSASGRERVKENFRRKRNGVHQFPGDFARAIDPLGGVLQPIVQVRARPAKLRQFGRGREQIRQQSIMNLSGNPKPFTLHGGRDRVTGVFVFVGRIQLNHPFLSKLANAFSSPSWISNNLFNLVILKTSITLGETSQNFNATP